LHGAAGNHQGLAINESLFSEKHGCHLAHILVKLQIFDLSQFFAICNADEGFVGIFFGRNHLSLLKVKKRLFSG